MTPQASATASRDFGPFSTVARLARGLLERVTGRYSRDCDAPRVSRAYRCRARRRISSVGDLPGPQRSAGVRRLRRCRGGHGRSGPRFLCRDRPHSGRYSSFLRAGAEPAYSPNGRSVAYGNGGIWLAGPDCRWPSRPSPTPCSRLRRLTRGNDSSPAWSPNGKRIAFSRSGSRIYTVGVNGGDARFLVRGASPDWSSKGALAFTAARDELELRVRDRGGRVRTLPVRGNQPSWAPGGKRLAFVGEENSPEGKSLYTVHADGTGLQKVWEFQGFYEEYFPAESPTWSPDGRWIAFIERAERVYAIRPGGGERRLLMGSVVKCRPCSARYDPNISALAWQPLRP